VQSLRRRHRTKLEEILSIFDQSYASKESRHFLHFVESSYPEEFKVIIRRLQKAVVSEELCEEMDLEDEFLEELANQERAIEHERAAKEEALAAQKSAIAEAELQKEENKKLRELLKKSGIEYQGT